MSPRPCHRSGLLFSALVVVCLASAAGAAEPRPSRWAKPLARAGLPNLNQVTPNLYRGAQPTAEGMKSLQDMGVKTVINLRQLHSDDRLLTGTSLRPVHIRVNTFHPEHEDIIAFLKAVTDPQAQPVFVHCQHGADRTGMMIAIYRMVVQGWPRAEAIREMREGGYSYHEIWKHIPKLLESVDVAALRKEAGIAAPE